MEQGYLLLYVDDEPINLMLFENIFKRKFNILTAISGYEGLEKLRSNPLIKAVVSDVKMPELNGIEFITLAKAEFPEIAYFILTGYGITTEIANALKSGLIIQSFEKPFKKDEIEQEIIRALQQNKNT